jgi:hypothetical protein
VALYYVQSTCDRFVEEKEEEAAEEKEQAKAEFTRRVTESVALYFVQLPGDKALA